MLEGTAYYPRERGVRAYPLASENADRGARLCAPFCLNQDLAGFQDFSNQVNAAILMGVRS